jgi:hypothetical protein
MLGDDRSKESLFEKAHRQYRFEAIAYDSLVSGGKCGSTWKATMRLLRPHSI